MKKITVGNEGRYNFHNVSDMTLHVKDDMLVYDEDGTEIVGIKLTPSQVRRVKNHFCGVSGCGCGSEPAGMEQIDYDRYIIHICNQGGDHRQEERR